MSYARYRLYLDGTPATAEQLGHFENITIEQEMDHACEGRFQVPLCIDKNGVWDGETEAFLQGMARIRLEVQVQSSDWVALIDGPIVNILASTFSEPGKSVLTVVVSDDSFFLHRDESVVSFDDSDDQIARQIFEEVPEIADWNIDDAPAPSNPGFDTTVLRGTPMECLQELARRQHMHAYVACGESPGQSVGNFTTDPDPTLDYGLTPMVLLGAGQNIFSFESDTTIGQMATFQSGKVSLQDRSTDTRDSDLSDIALLGTDSAPGPSIKRLMRPGQTDALTLARAVQAASERAAYALSAHGEVMKEVYGSVLQPYQCVDVLGANGRVSGRWLIQQVTHSLSRNECGQSFKVVRNAESSGTNSEPEQTPAEVH
jgi:hypothetical protein